jgi:glycosyltransferase involved in cell wall biosynthesis
MRVSLIITTYNRPEVLSLIFKSIEDQTICPDEIIIADDGSGNSTKECVEDFQRSSSISIIHSWQEDRGFRVAKSRNKAIAKSNYEYIILIDGDVILHEKFIENHLKHAETNFFVQGQRVLVNESITKKIINNQYKNLFLFSRGLKNRKNAIYSAFLSKIFLTRKNVLNGIKTCNLAFYKSDCIKVNGFNNEIEGWGREDSEFVARLFNNNVCRKNIHFNMIQFHLWHQDSSREVLQKNNIILQKAIESKLNWCDNGINQYL